MDTRGFSCTLLYKCIADGLTKSRIRELSDARGSGPRQGGGPGGGAPWYQSVRIPYHRKDVDAENMYQVVFYFFYFSCHSREVKTGSAEFGHTLAVFCL